MQVNPSRFATTAAVLVALVASSVDALSFTWLYINHVLYWPDFFLRLPAFPGEFGA